MGKDSKVSLDTMTGVGKKKTLAGREYTILPVNIRDMHYIIGESEEKLVILNKPKEGSDEEIDWQVFGLNIIDEKRKAIFLKVVNKYVFYKEHPMTEELLIEHNWSFKEIGEFLFTWCQISD